MSADVEGLNVGVSGEETETEKGEKKRKKEKGRRGGGDLHAGAALESCMQIASKTESGNIGKGNSQANGERGVCV